MGLFKKKSDPISDRARELNDKIAALEAEIKRLATQPTPEPEEPSPAEPEPAPVPHPRLRSTARPRGAAPKPQTSTTEVFLEQPDQQRLKERHEKSAPEPRPELGTAKSDFSSLWRRFKNNFRGPATSNPKLVNYLAAGSIQGLRPLRYEKRVARNRFIVLSGILILLLWGIVAIFLRHR
jgi:hypothetical protein